MVLREKPQAEGQLDSSTFQLGEEFSVREAKDWVISLDSTCLFSLRAQAGESGLTWGVGSIGGAAGKLFPI